MTDDRADPSKAAAGHSGPLEHPVEPAPAPAALADAEAPARRGPAWVPGPRHRARLRHVGRKAGHVSLGLVALGAVLALVAGLGLWALLGRTLALPVWAVAEVESRANAALAQALPGAGVAIGGIDVTVEDSWTPRLKLEDVRLLQGDEGTTLLVLPEVRVAFDGPSFATERTLRPSSLRILGASLDLRRAADGRLDLRIGGAGAGPQVQGLAGVLAALDAAFATPALSRLTTIEAQATTLTLEDALTGREWSVGDGRIRLDNRPDELAAEIGMTLQGGGETAAQTQVTVVRPKGAGSLRLSAAVDQLAAADLAAQTPVLGWLGVLDAPLSGRIRAELTPAGLEGLEAELDLGPGALRPSAEARAIDFDRAGLRLSYDPAEGRILLSDVSIQGPSLRLEASGQSYMLDEQGQILTGTLGAAVPSGFLGQVSIREAEIDPEGLFERPLRFATGAMDARLRLDPFQLDIGQISLVDERGRRLSLSGEADAQAAGWQVSIDLALDAIAHDRLLQLWPRSLIPATRAWLGENVAQGLLSNVRAALRLSPGADPRVFLGYEFDRAEVRFLRTLPPIRDGRGRSSLDGKTYVIALDEGRIDAPQGGGIDVAGSAFRVPDVTQKPAMADIRLKTDSSITAALSLLDLPPFSFMTKAGQPVDLGQGRAVVDTRLSLPLKPRVELPDITYAVDGQIIGLSSDVLVKGRRFTAPSLRLAASPEGLEINGPGLIDGVACNVTFRQGFGPEDKGRSQITGTVALTPEALEVFDVGLPAGMVRGAGQARIDIALQRDAPARMTLTSDLVGIGLQLAPVGWSKPEAAKGALTIDAVLGTPPQVERLAIEAPGLRAEGRVQLRAGGGLELAQFTEVELGGWLSGGVELRGRAAGQAPDVVVTRGQIDMRRFDAPRQARANGGEDSGKILVQLDRLIVADSLSLIGFQGNFSQRGGFNGSFTGSLNGSAPVEGTVVPSRYGQAIRFVARDAGAALKAAGVFSSARGGTLEMRLTARQQEGQYDSRVEMKNLRVQKTNVLAELLSAVSVVGLLEQLNGTGILFATADFDLVITPTAIRVSNGSAIGASLGVTMAGIYATQTGGLDLQGVISPVYLLNGIGSALTRRGEGLFGFNYSLRGTADDPEVQVNPLSILTPGMFREIFRGPTPGAARPPGQDPAQRQAAPVVNER